MTTESVTDPLLVVESGAQRDARVPLLPGPRTAGSDVDCDVVLFDPALAGTHFTLEREAGGVRLRALGDAVSLSDGTTLAPGEAALCTATTRFRAGETALRLDLPSRPAAEPGPARRRRGRGALAGIAAGVLCAVFAAGVAVVAATPAMEAVRSRPARAEAAATPLPAAPAVADALSAVHSRLAASGIETISLTAVADGSIAAQGQVPPSQQAAWREVERWFDGAYDGRAVLVDQVRVAAEAPPLAVQAVWPGQDPYVVDGSGEKLFVGAALPGGWTIESISAERVLLRRGGQALAVRF